MDRLSEEWYPLPIKIAGVGCYLPKRVVSSQEIEEKYGLEDGWCAENLGVLQRRWAADETPSFMGAEAVKEAVEMANLDLEDIDLIINASSTSSFERGLPDGGPLIQQQLGLENSGIPAFTMQNNCMSFMLALDVCATMLITGRYQNILVVSSEILSCNLDSNNPEVYGLFGDGAAAAVVTLTPGGETGVIHDVRFETYSRGAAFMQSKLGFIGSKIKNVQPEELTLQMDAEAFYKYGNQYARKLIEKLFKEHNRSIEDIKIVIPQQGGKRFPDHPVLSIPGEKFIRIIDRFGFCGAASIPMALYEAVKEEKLARGDQFLMVGIGAGLSVGAMILTY